MQLAQCTLEIDLAKIKANYRILRNICTNSAVGAAVKANSYGLGANQISKALEEEHCRFFFVASSIEGINLRKILSSHSNILVLNGVSQNDAAEFVEYNLIPVLNNLEQIKIWQQFAKTRNQLLPCFLHFNTGINRLGLTHAEIELIINDRDLLEGLQLQYIISHLAASEEAENPYNFEQLTKFKSYLQHFPSVKTSLASSSAIFLGKNYHFDLVRPGMALYGLNPLGKGKPNPMQNPVTLTAPIIHLQKLTTGSSIGYNRSFITERDSIIATLPLGYADGYSRNFSNCGEVFINGYVAPVIGRVSMDLVNLVNNYNILELGSNVGLIGYEIQKRFPESFSLTGVESSTVMNNLLNIYYPNTKIYDQVFEVSIPDFIKQSSDKFSVVLSFCGLSFTSNLKIYFDAIYSLLNESGYFAFCLPVAASTSYSLKRKEFIFNLDEIIEILNTGKFTILSSQKLMLAENNKYCIVVCKKASI